MRDQNNGIEKSKAKAVVIEAAEGDSQSTANMLLNFYKESQRKTSEKPTMSNKRPGNRVEKRSKIKIPEWKIVQMMVYQQDIAAEKIGVSISTLKRRFYELSNHGRWSNNTLTCDHPEYVYEPLLLPKSGKRAKLIANVVNKEEEDVNHIASEEMKILNRAFKCNL